MCGVGGEDAGEDVCGRYAYDVDYVSVCLLTVSVWFICTETVGAEAYLKYLFNRLVFLLVLVSLL